MYYILDQHLELDENYTTEGQDIAIFRSGEDEPVVTVHKSTEQWPEIAQVVVAALNAEVQIN